MTVKATLVNTSTNEGDLLYFREYGGYVVTAPEEAPSQTQMLRPGQSVELRVQTDPFGGRGLDLMGVRSDRFQPVSPTVIVYIPECETSELVRIYNAIRDELDRRNDKEADDA